MMTDKKQSSPKATSRRGLKRKVDAVELPAPASKADSNPDHFTPVTQVTPVPDSVASAAPDPGQVTQVTQVTQDPVTATKDAGDAEAKGVTALLRNTQEHVKLTRTPDGVPYATSWVSDHFEVWPVRSRAFRHWIMQAHHANTKKVPSKHDVDGAVEHYEGMATLLGRVEHVHCRVAEAGGKFYLDLANDRWEVMEIDEEGWRIVSRSPVKFRRPHGMRALPYPVGGGSVELLWPFVNLGGDSDRVLLVSVLVSYLRPRGPYPILVLTGEKGSAKSTTARVIRELVDPNGVPLRAMPRDEHELMIAAGNARILSFDNVSRLSNWLSDALCRLATGGGMSARKLYTDNEEALFNTQSPVVINGIDQFVVRSDLSDRTVTLYLPIISAGQRRTEEEFWNQFEAVRPLVLGALLDGLSTGLRRSASLGVLDLPRLADFARFAGASEPAFGWEDGTFRRAYEANLAEADEQVLEASPLTEPLRLLMKDGPWFGNATKLKELLEELLPQRRPSGWPANSKLLADELRRIAPNLRKTGYEVRFVPHGRSIVLTPPKPGDSCVTTVTCVTPPEEDVVPPSAAQVSLVKSLISEAGPPGVPLGRVIADLGVSPFEAKRALAAAGAVVSGALGNWTFASWTEAALAPLAAAVERWMRGKRARRLGSPH